MILQKGLAFALYINPKCSKYLIQCPASPISPVVYFSDRPVSGYASKSGMIGYIVIDTAVPLSALAPAEAIHAAPIFAMDAFRTGISASPFIMSAILNATSRAIHAFRRF